MMPPSICMSTCEPALTLSSCCVWTLLRGLGELTLYRWSCCFLLQTLLRGLGELHLEIVVDKLRRQFNVPVETGQAYVAYREGVMNDVSGVKAVYVTPSRRSKEPCPADPISAPIT